MKKNILLLVLASSFMFIVGCTQVVTAPVSIAGSAVGATIDVAGSAVGAAVDIATTSDDEEK